MAADYAKKDDAKVTPTRKAATAEGATGATADGGAAGGPRYLVSYPAISISYEKEPTAETSEGGQPAPQELVTMTIPQNRYLDEFVPAEVAAEKGPFLVSIGHVRAVARGT